MEKLKLTCKIMVISGWGIVLGYLTAIRTEVSDFWLWILDDGILAILSLVLLVTFLPKTSQMKNLLGVFGGAISIGHDMIPSIRLFLTVGEHEYSFLMSAVFDFIFMSLIFYFFGSVVLFCLRERKTTVFLYSLFAVFFLFCLSLNGCDTITKSDWDMETEIKQTSGTFTYSAIR